MASIETGSTKKNIYIQKKKKFIDDDSESGLGSNTRVVFKYYFGVFVFVFLDSKKEVFVFQY